MNNDTPHQLELQLPDVTLCACGCGTPLPKPQFPSRQRRFIVGHGTRGITYVRKSLSERFWEKVDKRSPGECWNWTGYCDRDGYGHIRYDDPNHTDMGAHRVSYELHYGCAPNDMYVCHTCDNPSCVNPHHLFLGTNQDNVSDMVAKGRKRWAIGESTGSAKLTTEQVIAIRQKYAAGQGTMYTIASEYATTPGNVCNIIHRKIWKHIP